MSAAGRIDLRLTAAELEAYARAAGPLGIAAWARAVLSETAGIATLARGRGPDKTPRKRRTPARLFLLDGTKYTLGEMLDKVDGRDTRAHLENMALGDVLSIGGRLVSCVSIVATARPQ